jgi:hypothetical protein
VLDLKLIERTAGAFLNEERLVESERTDIIQTQFT